MVLSADDRRGPSRRSRPPGLKPVKTGARSRKRVSKSELRLVDRTVLGSLTGEQPANAYAVVQALRHPDGESLFVESSIYRAIARLVDQAYLEQGEAATAKGPRATYTPTLQGIEAMERWVRTPASLPIQVANEAWLRMAATRFSLTSDVLDGLSTLPAEVDRRLVDLELETRRERQKGGWDIASELEYQLEREVLEACSRWANTAVRLLESEGGARA
jgi:DNA-binding PadR family transcriptional regulator